MTLTRRPGSLDDHEAMAAGTNGVYRIAQVSALTGVSEHTLRAWERRYGVPRPARTTGGQRTYSAAEIELVRRMKQLAGQGVPLAEAARLAVEEVRQPADGPRIQRLTASLRDALLAFDEPSAATIWTELFDSLDLMAAFEQVVVPLMRDVGVAWHEGRATVAQEHFATNFVRARLDQLSRQVQPFSGAPIVVLACLEGEHHEIGLLMLAVMLRFQGVRTIYLGQDVPDEDLIRTVEDSQPDVLAVNAGTPEGARHLPGIVERLRETAPLTSIVYGGGAFDRAPELHVPGARYGGAELPGAAKLINDLARARNHGGAS